MTYNPSIPGSSDLISQSQSQIQTNFSQANTAFGVDHTAFDVVSNQGKHKKVTLVEGSDPATSANEIALYSKDLSGVSTLYMRKESSGTVIQMSGIDPSKTSSGYTFLPGGIIIQWGLSAAAANGATVNFPIAFPGGCFNVQVTINTASSSVSNVGINGFSTTGFTFRTNASASVPISFFAIGY